MELGLSAGLPFKAQLRGVSRWAGSRVDAVAEAMSARAAPRAAWQTLLFADGDGIEIYLRRGRAPARYATLAPGFGDRAAADLARSLNKRARRHVAVRLGPNRAIVRRIDLPGGAGDVVEAIVRNRIESMGPWPTADALWGFRIVSDAKADPMTVEVGIAGRAAVDALLARLARAGLAVERLDIGATALDEDPIPLDVDRPRRLARARRTLRIGLAAVSAATLAAFVTGAALAWSVYAELAETEDRIAELTNGLKDRTAVKQSDPLIADASALIDRKRAERPVIEILDALTQAIPDGTWLERLDLAEGQLVVAGNGAPIPPVIEALESTAAFESVTFAAATRRAAGAVVDSFSLSAAIAPASAPP